VYKSLHTRTPDVAGDIAHSGSKSFVIKIWNTNLYGAYNTYWSPQGVKTGLSFTPRLKSKGFVSRAVAKKGAKGGRATSLDLLCPCSI